MGYANDVRVLLPEAEFNALDKKLREKGCFREYDVKGFRSEGADDVKKYSPEREPLRFVYFGWNCISWYNDEFVDAVESAVYASENCHFMRMGEEHTDVEESYGLTNAHIDCISISRHFDDEYEEG
ncbi:MAG: hypothetical protein FWH03_00950 [Firmicutes bacterium]|nr:hypothetical protein [Bacillota bacterium]